MIVYHSIAWMWRRKCTYRSFSGGLTVKDPAGVLTAMAQVKSLAQELRAMGIAQKEKEKNKGKRKSSYSA